jgi:hypothetical protein
LPPEFHKIKACGIVEGGGGDTTAAFADVVLLPDLRTPRVEVEVLGVEAVVVREPILEVVEDEEICGEGLPDVTAAALAGFGVLPGLGPALADEVGVGVGVVVIVFAFVAAACTAASAAAAPIEPPPAAVDISKVGFPAAAAAAAAAAAPGLAPVAAAATAAAVADAAAALPP